MKIGGQKHWLWRAVDEHALDPVSILVGVEVAGDGLLAVRLGRDHWKHTLHEQGHAHLVAVITFIGKHHLEGLDRESEEFVYGLVVRDFAAGKDKAERAALTV